MGNILSDAYYNIFIPETPPPAIILQKRVETPIKKEILVETPDRDDYGWFEDPEPQLKVSEDNLQTLHKALSNPSPLAVPPAYILESSLETQKLWYATAGLRPQQPDKERKYFEKLWSQNFQSSSVEYSPEETKVEDIIPTSEINGSVLEKGQSLFSNSVSKSFADDHIQSITILVPQYRIMETKSRDQYAEFLVLISIGSHATVTFGIWKRHTEFEKLLNSLQTKQQASSLFKNTMLSWQCLMQRKKWYKCLDKEYLSLKCFLLERFVHDMLFESQTPDLLLEFLGFVASDSNNIR